MNGLLQIRKYFLRVENFLSSLNFTMTLWFQSILPWSAWNFQSILLISPGISSRFYWSPLEFLFYFTVISLDFQSILLVSPGISSRFYWSPVEFLFYFTVTPLDFQSILLVSSQFYRELLGYSIRFNRNWYPPGIYGNSPPSFCISPPGI